MFVDRLSNQEKQYLLTLLINIAEADGNICPDERDFVAGYAAENDIPFDLDSPRGSLLETCAKITAYSAKIVTLQELVKIAICDGHYSGAERAGIAAIARLLELGEEKVLEIEQWVGEGHAWLNRGESLLAA